MPRIHVEIEVVEDNPLAVDATVSASETRHVHNALETATMIDASVDATVKRVKAALGSSAVDLKELDGKLERIS